MLHRLNGTVPTNPVSQLRYIVYELTNQTMLIKNKMMREIIKHSAAHSGDKAHRLFMRCDSAGLASIFLRFKPIFLAFKTHDHCAPFINSLRRLADTHHRPLAADSLQNLVNVTDPQRRAEIITRASNRDLVKVLNSIHSRGAAPGVYAIRNGRTFVREGAQRLTQTSLNSQMALSSVIISVLRDRLTPALHGKIFYLPDYIEYAVPTTERQFIGNIPYGSRILGTPASAFTMGIHWFNQKGAGNMDDYWHDRDGDRVDIDLHMNSATRHFGWNAEYRDGEEVLYTGDLTTAPLPHGAAEAYWFTPGRDTYILSANLYAGPRDTEFKFFMTEVRPSTRSSHRNRQDKNYTYKADEALFPAIPLKFNKDERAMTIGMVTDESEFFFYGGTLNNAIVPRANYAAFIDGLTAQLANKLPLTDLLLSCGAAVIGDEGLAEIQRMDDPAAVAQAMEQVISLAPEDLASDTLLNIIDGR
jgi:hypothetical protein